MWVTKNKEIIEEREERDTHGNKGFNGGEKEEIDSQGDEGSLGWQKPRDYQAQIWVGWQRPLKMLSVRKK